MFRPTLDNSALIADPTPDDPTVPPHKELFDQVGRFTLVFALLHGLGAFVNIVTLRPTPYTFFAGGLFLVTLLLAPRGALRAVRLPKTLIAFVSWMVLSYAWSSYKGGFVKVTAQDLVTISIIVVVGQLLPIERFMRTLVTAGYSAIALMGVALVVVPSKAYVKVDAAPGLRGGFVHKNQMGPAVIMVAAAVLACERRPAVRRGVVIGVVMLLVLGRTTTGLASMMLTVGLYAVLVRYPMVKRKLGRTFQFLMFVMVIVSAVAYVVVNRMIISLSGKDLTFSNRTSIWSEVMAAWRSKPLTGYGWSVWQAVFLQPVNGIITRLGFVVAESHNAAVELLFRLGVVGLVLYLLVLLTALVRGLKLVRAGDPVGVFTVLLVALMVTWGFSEALPTSGAWIGLVAVFAVPRPVGNRQILGAARGPRRRLFSPGPQRVR